MSDNKFIERLKGKETAKSVLEVKNQATKLSFANMPQGTSNAIDVFSDHRGNATAVLNGTTNWKISNSNLLLATTVSGDGQDFLSTYSVSGTGLWVNASYTFPSTGDPRHPIAMVFNPSTKWVLKVCGDNLIVDGGSTIDFTMLVKIGTANVYSKNFTVRESAGQFSKEFVIDFGEANLDIVKAGGLSTLTVQLLCGTANASARIYNGMSVLTCLQRKVDASAVSNNGGNVEDVLNGNMIPTDYFSNPAFIDQIEDGDEAYAVFTRDGDNVDLSGWTQPIPDQANNNGKFLTTDGSSMSWEQIEISNVDGLQTELTDLSNALNAKANNTNRVNGAPLSNTTSTFYGVSDTAAATVQKEVSIPSITTLDAGTAILVKPTVTSTVANSSIKLNDFPAYPMHYAGSAISTSTDSIVWAANTPSWWVFDGTYWVFAGHGLDSNTTYTLNYSVDAGQYTAGSGSYAITRYSILAQKPNGTWEKITATNATYSSGTSKSVNTSGFILNQLRYYGTTTTVASGVKVATNVMYEKAASVDMRYSTNCGAITTWALGDYIYLVGTIGADGLFYLDTTAWWTNTLPSTNDGKLYIRLGLVLSNTGYTMSFFEDRPIFYHDGIGIKEYKVADNKQDVISDLATIRSGASAGATAVQPADLANYVTTNTTQTITGEKVFSGLMNYSAGKTYILAGNGGTKLGYWSYDIDGQSNITLQTMTASTRNINFKTNNGGKVTYNGSEIAKLSDLPGVMTGASAGDAGTSGLVPAPAAGDQAKFLQGDGTWANPTAATAWGNITGTLSNQTDLQSALDGKADVATTLAGYGITDGANTDLSNLTSVGQNISNWSSNVTNCITEIPQDIKLELNNGTLTLKAGSKVYVPNGVGVFDELIIQNDITLTSTLNRTAVLVVNTNNIGIAQYADSMTFSGNTAPSGQQYMQWYDTANNLVKQTNNSGSTWTSGFSLPFAMVTITSAGIQSIDQVFNGFGYIGSTVFALPGVKGLIPDGRNADGSLKNIEVTVNNVLTHTGSYNEQPQWVIIYGDSISSWDSVYWIGYNSQENILFNKEGWSSATSGSKIVACVGAFLSADGNQKITSFTPKTAFHAVDYSDTEFIGHQAMPSNKYINLTLGASGSSYTAPADGYFVLTKSTSANGQFIQLGSGAWSGPSIFSWSGSQYNACHAFLPARKGQVITVDYTAGGSGTFRFYYANGAQ